MNGGAGPPRSRFGSHFGIQITGWNEIGDSSSNSLNEDDEDRDDESNQEWGLGRDMELFEVSAKDDVGQCFSLFCVLRPISLMLAISCSCFFPC